MVRRDYARVLRHGECVAVLPLRLRCIPDPRPSRRAVVCCYTEKSSLPWWALIVALIVAILILPFYGAMYAISAVQLVITNLFQILGAALVPGSSQANMVSVRSPATGCTLTGVCRSTSSCTRVRRSSRRVGC